MKKKTMSDDVADEGLDPMAREFLSAFRSMSEEDQDALARVVFSWGESGGKGLTMEKLKELVELAKRLH